MPCAFTAEMISITCFTTSGASPIDGSSSRRSFGPARPGHGRGRASAARRRRAFPPCCALRSAQARHQRIGLLDAFEHELLVGYEVAADEQILVHRHRGEDAPALWDVQQAGADDVPRVHRGEIGVAPAHRGAGAPRPEIHRQRRESCPRRCCRAEATISPSCTSMLSPPQRLHPVA